MARRKPKADDHPPDSGHVTIVFDVPVIIDQPLADDPNTVHANTGMRVNYITPDGPWSVRIRPLGETKDPAP